MDNALLLDAARRGDQDAAGRLLQAHRPLIHGYLKSRTRSRDDCDDLVQNVFLRATRNLDSFRSDCPLSQWLLRIAANELKNYYERSLSASRMTVSEFDRENYTNPQHSETSLGPYNEAEDRSVVDQLVAIAKAVCGQDEFAVLMMFYQGENLEDVSRLLRLKAATVRSHFLRARGKLLAHVVRHEPALVGGNEGIQRAVKLAQDDGQLAPKEADSFARFDPRSELCRGACLKIAKHLPLPILLLLMEGPWTI